MVELERRLCEVKATPSEGSQATLLLVINPICGFSLAPSDRCWYEQTKENKRSFWACYIRQNRPQQVPEQSAHDGSIGASRKSLSTTPTSRRVNTRPSFCFIESWHGQSVQAVKTAWTQDRQIQIENSHQRMVEQITLQHGFSPLFPGLHTNV